MTEHKDKRGGARQGAGRKAEDGAAGLVLYPIKMPPELKAWCQQIGAAEVRRILAEAKQTSQ
jgi:hypothetical protein